MLRTTSFAVLSLVLAAALALVLQPVGTNAQFAIAAGCLSAMLLIRLLKLEYFWRHLFLTLGAVLVLRYVYWRSTASLPSTDSLQNFIPGMLVYAAEMFCVLMFAISMFVIARPITRKRAPQLSEQQAPTVDVFVPSYNEGTDMLAITLAAAQAMDYPRDKLKVYLLDDGGTDEKVNASDPLIADAALERRRTLQDLCQRLGVQYLTRERNVHAKAGNLTNGLIHSQGELVVVFDADHAPTKEFLRETVGHFKDDPKLFLVQTPHFFLNADPIEKNLATFDRMPSENEMFYSVIQKGLDKWNAAYFCGSAAVLRRSALEQTGGFAGSSITEDCETALELHAMGWNSLYVDKALIAGLQPETFTSFIGQRSRWCRGMLQILILKNPIMKRGLSLAQRVCYLSSTLFWFFPIPRLVFILAPLLYIFFDLKIYNSTPSEFIAYTATYILAAIILQSYAFGRFRWPWVSELYEYVQAIYLLPAIVSVIRNPRRPTFNVTAKGLTTDEDHLSELAWPYFVMFALLLAGQITTFYRMQHEPDAVGLLLIVALWNAFNLVIAGLALGVVSERRERRRTQRVLVKERGVLEIDGVDLPVRINDVSMGGALVQALGAHKIPLRATATLRVGSAGEAEFSDPITVRIANVRSRGEKRIVGLNFAALNPAEYRTLAALMYGDMALLRRSRQVRQRTKGLLVGTGQIMAWAVRQSLRGIYFALFRRGTPAGAAS